MKAQKFYTIGHFLIKISVALILYELKFSSLWTRPPPSSSSYKIKSPNILTYKIKAIQNGPFTLSLKINYKKDIKNYHL